MNPRTIVFIVVAIAIAGGTAMLVQNYLRNQQARILAGIPKQKAPPKAHRILVAKRGLPAGTLIKRDQLEWHPWPQDKINKVYIKSDGKRKIKEFVGAVVPVGIAAGEPVTDGRIVKPGQRGFLAAALPPGMRAMTLSINATSGIAGFVFPGDRVDIILSHRVRAGGRKKQRVSETIMENVRIIAVDQITGDKKGKAKVRRTATLELTPKQVEFLTVAKSMGRLSFSLRAITKEEIEQNRIAEVDPNDPTPVVPAERGKTYTSETEVSRLFGNVGDGSTVVVTVFRGKKAQTTRLRSILR